MTTIAVVRAVPYPPHKRRWCGLERWVPDPKNRPQQEMREKPEGGFEPVFIDGKPVYAKHALPWPAEDVKVEIVDNPAPFDPNANGGYPVQISPATFAMLQKDERILARILDGSGSSEDSVSAKAAAAKASEELETVRRELAAAQERAKTNAALRESAEQEAKIQAKKAEQLEKELEAARAQIGKKR